MGNEETDELALGAGKVVQRDSAVNAAEGNVSGGGTGIMLRTHHKRSGGNLFT
jgi:hypothetical protein